MKNISYFIFFLSINWAFTYTLFAQEKNTSMDCDLIYDEYDSLMLNQYLINPDQYVKTQKNEFNADDYIRLQKNKLKLHSGHKDYAVVIFKTNQNLYGKMLLSFTKHAQFDATGSIESNSEQNKSIREVKTLTIHEVIVYQRIKDGYGPVHFGPISIKIDHTFDIDGFGHFPIIKNNPDTKEEKKKHQRSDLLIYSEKNSINIRAINDAKIYLPISSLCH